MSRRFEIFAMTICPFDRVVGGLKPRLDYPIRYCVLDKEQGIAIDIKTKQKYQYIVTVNNTEFSKEEYKKIEPNKRYAIFPTWVYVSDILDLNETKKIIDDLKNSVEFQDGNEVFDNEKYLEYVQNEQLDKKNNSKKAKKIGKRRK